MTSRTSDDGSNSHSSSIQKERLLYDFESPIQEALHMDLKRNLGAGITAQNGSKSPSSNQTMIDGPLFHKYQFFTPGKHSDSRPPPLPVILFHYLFPGLEPRLTEHGTNDWGVT
jgi:hypothetical protein